VGGGSIGFRACGCWFAFSTINCFNRKTTTTTKTDKSVPFSLRNPPLKKQQQTNKQTNTHTQKTKQKKTPPKFKKEKRKKEKLLKVLDNWS